MNQEVGREIIRKNYVNPYNKVTIDNPNYIKVNTNNESCIDNIDLQILIEDGKIADIKFNGEACAIAISSTSIMIKELIGKSISQALEVIKNFEAMLEEKEYNKNLFNEAEAFKNLQPESRKTCAILPYRGILKTLESYNK